MKKVVLFTAFLLSVGSIFAQQVQERIGVKSVIGAAASQQPNLNLQLTQTRNGVNGTFTIKSVGIQVGLPYMGIIDASQTNNPTQNYQRDLGFPWGIRYVYSTFSDDAFTVSKGYYTDKVLINWIIKNNASLISDFVIYRTTDISSSNPVWGNPIGTLAKTARSFEDITTEGGKLYRYKVQARGVENVPAEYSSFITGIGYRNPTAVITGNVSFNAGNPVKGVLISATPTGTTLNFGTSLRIPSTTAVEVNNLHKNLKDSLTLQAWVKPETNFNNDVITLYHLKSNMDNSKYFKVKLSVVNNRSTLTLTIEEPSMGDQIITLSDYIPTGEVDNKGDDILVPISTVNGSFTHFTAVLRNNVVPEIYINGRLINATYAAKMNTILANSTASGTTPPTVVFTSSNVVTRLNTSATGYPQTWTRFSMGGGKTALLDEFRVWETALTPAQILTDYRRYLKGNEAYLHTYITGNEGTGNFAYDLSSTGFDFHGNDAKLNNAAEAVYPNAPTSLVQSGLVVNLDAGQTGSYPGTGSAWTNIGSGGSAYNATLLNSPAYSANYGGNLAFNGTNQSTSITRPVQDDFTLSAWFKTSSNAGVLGESWTGLGIIDGETPNIVNDYGVTMAQGRLMFGVGNPETTITSPRAYNDNNWHQVVCTRLKSTGAMVMYVDGVQVATGTGNTNSLTSTTVLKIGRSDVNRFFPGSISAIHIYNATLNANEVQQNYNYFFARHVEPRITFSTVIPTNTQLGVLGVTDKNGNYVISAVPYTGNGNSYTLVPSLGKHKFNPNQQLVYVGVGSTVINNANFKDISSFSFRGRVLYDSRGVFPTTSDAAIRGDIRDNEAYNAYTANNRKYQKGEYWAYKNAAGTIDSLRRFAPIPVPGVYINIDNTIAMDANNTPVLTDLQGYFTIQVPIGEHAISVFKSGHNFSSEGRYPARTSSVVNGETVIANTYLDFFQDQDEAITFIDTTKITVIGRVVGGTAQAEKTIGFGHTGKKTYTYTDTDGVTKSVDYSSTNNIGVARLTLGYIPAGSTSVTPEYRTRFETNATSGEFRVKLLPLSYTLSQNDLVFKSTKNPGDRPLLTADRNINFTTITPYKTPKFATGNLTGEPYQEELKFTYLADPTFRVVSQSSESTIVSGSKTYTIAADQQIPIYKQFGTYKVEVEGLETYNNYDNSLTNPVVSTVPVTGGQIIATNNLALENSESVATSTTNPSILVYSFRGGMPNTSATTGYKRTINLKYRLNDIDYPLTNYKTEGIVLGGESDGTQTFVTAGPELPDFVLRDPPGSGSSATIEKGSTLSFTRSLSTGVTAGYEEAVTVKSGVSILSTILAGPAIKATAEVDNTVGLSFQQSSATGSDVTNTYSFSQSISTSSDAGWDGSDADLYVGYSANQFYGTYNDLTADSISNSSTPIKVVANTGSSTTLIYPKIKTAIYFTDAPQKTFFVYSQASILNDLIPKYQGFIDQIDAGTLVENQGGVLTKRHYLNSINLWRRIIRNNEQKKYQAFNQRDALKASLYDNIDALRNPVTSALSANAQQLRDLVNKSFFENISFDAGVGDITKTTSIERVGASSLSFDLEVGASFAKAFEGTINETGIAMEASYSAGGTFGYASSSENANSTTVSYTLNDTDDNNLLSVDVINAFDGNGPIFITKGGQTSCPYEGEELSNFYNPTHPNVTNPNAFITDLLDTDKVPLSVATVALEKPEIRVLSSNVTGVYEGRNAEFVLQLRNTSTANKDATFVLVVDQNTNPDNALINIEPNGTFINIPAGQTVTYTMTLKKVKADQFNYNNIKVSLNSTCDDDATSSVNVSASFVPSCSSVSVLSPSNNWLLNRNTAYEGSTTKPVNIKLGDYSTTFANLQKFNLEYRLKGTPNWTTLRTYYKNQADLNTARTGGDNNVELIAGNQLNYAWDIAGLGLSDGSYEIRATSTCTNNTNFESAVIQGTVNLSNPVQFGAATPTNGILGIGDNLSVRFNEPVKKNGQVSNFEFLVQKNQLPNSHNVSLAFNGSSNKATISKPYITTGNLGIEFWMKNTSPSGTSTLISQSGGLKVELIDNALKFTLGNQSISATILKDGNFNHYTLSYDASIPKLSIIENDRELTGTTLVPNPTTVLSFTNANPIVLGGSTFKGNIHDLRLWSIPVTRDQSVANMNVALTGNESGLLGLWPLNEGNGTLGKDLARFKSLDIASANWDIYPKGNSYDFSGTNSLATNTNTFSKVVISKEMNTTLTFWMKTAQANATILSNGKGDSTDVVESNQFRNKWAFNTTAAGGLELAAEGRKYAFGTKLVNDNAWHHIAVSLTRNGGLQLYVDGNVTGSFATTNVGGLSSSKLFIGARGQSNATTTTMDRYFVGQIDELCIWNMARTADQIKAGMYFELDHRTTGLLFYSNFNKPEPANSNGPKYYYPQDSFMQVADNLLPYTTASSTAPGGTITFTDVTPAIKPYLLSEVIPVTAVINNDQILLVPEISNWASVEGKVADVTVSELIDMYDNRQQSPATWRVFISKNPVKMFVEGQGDIANLVRTTDSLLVFPITIVNQGGVQQPYSFNVPNWLKLSSYSGTIEPTKSLTVMATVDMNLAPGNYNNLISLATNYGVDKKVQLNLRVLMKEPRFTFSPANFTQSMNIVGQIKVNGIFENDLYDKVYAVAQGANGLELRGKAGLSYDRALDAYALYLTVYSNVVSGENISFFIWDANKGNFLEATINGVSETPFIADKIIGSFSNPALFANTTVAGQLITLNPGWTWASFNVSDPRFTNLNQLTSGMNLSTSDQIQSIAPSLFDSYQFYSTGSALNGWSGGISSNGGISTNKMYKIKIANGGELKMKGVPADLTTWSFNLQTGWNWLPYVANKNIPIGDALANLDPSDGDLIKSQNLFATYSSAARAWKGSLTYLNQSEGYMINVTKAQTFTYPDYINRINDAQPVKDIFGKKATANKTAMLTVEDKSTPLIEADYSKFANTMSAVVKLPEGFNELYFYNEAGELRGNAKTMLVDGKELAFITLYSDKTETLTAHIGTNNVTQSTSKRFDFSPDGILGSIAKPVLIELEQQDVFVFPNPFHDELKIEVNTPEKGDAKIAIYNLASSHTLFEKSFTVEAGSSVLKMEPNIPTGAYLIKVQVGPKVVVKKIMKN